MDRISLLEPGALHRAVTLRDLTDPEQGVHAMQLVVDHIVHKLQDAWRCEVVLHRGSPITTIEDNYDRLHYAPDGVARDARYTRYVTPRSLLRTHTSAMIPALLRTLAGSQVHDVLLACPGLVYRRDCIDRLHVGEPHQIDLWRLWEGPPATQDDLQQMVGLVVAAALPTALRWRSIPARHPYTRQGRQIEVRRSDQWIEIGECGVASPKVLREAGLPEGVTGLAMGLGLDRLLMLRKDIEDIRLLRSEDTRVSAQMTGLEPYRTVSRQPAAKRDMSLAIADEASAEDLGDRVRALRDDIVRCIESLEVLSETAYDDLPTQAITRIGMRSGQKNVLVRLLIRDLDRSLTSQEANEIRDRIYLHLHEGSKSELSPAPK